MTMMQIRMDQMMKKKRNEKNTYYGTDKNLLASEKRKMVKLAGNIYSLG